MYFMMIMNLIHDLSRVDLNLLLVFAAIDETRHVTRAAKSLGVSQSALSHALRRLRETFGDPLFVKATGTMAATPRALELAGPIRAALAALQRDVFSRSALDLASLKRTFRVYTTDLIEAMMMPPLLSRCAAEAPGAQLATIPLGFTLPKEALESGACDLAIAGFFGEAPTGFYKQRLFDDGFRCAVRSGHPRLGTSRQLSLDAYCAETHLLIAPTGDLTGVVDQALKRQKRARRVVAGASSYGVTGWIVADSDCILTAPERLIRLLGARFPLRSFAPPLALPDIRMTQVWHERNHADPAHRWFRERVRDALK